MRRRPNSLFITFVIALLALVGPARPTAAYIFLGPDTDTSICANIGSGQHTVTGYPNDWPQIDQLNFGSPPTLSRVPWNVPGTNWLCRTDTGLTTGGRSCAGWTGADGRPQSLCAGGEWIMSFPVGTPATIGKADLEHHSGSGSFPRDLTKVEWDLDGDGSFETVDTGPWPTALGTTNEQVDSTVTAWTTRARYFEATFVPQNIGSTTVQMKVTWNDASTVTSSGIFTATADTTTAELSRTLSLGGETATGPALTNSPVYLSAGSSSSTSGFFSKYEWDLDGNGTYEVDGGTVNTYTTNFTDSGAKSVGVRVTSRGGSTDTATTSIEVRKAPPSGEPGLSVLDGAIYTNTKTVTLSLTWPEYATEARISNDGGFATAKTKVVPLAASVDWDLDDSLKGIYTKVVYVRFNGSGVDNTKTYSDDIILDATPPTVESASITATSGSVELSLKATDDITGVDKVELASNTFLIQKDYSNKVTVPAADLGLVVTSAAIKKSATSTLRFRVSDIAGNWTAWRSVLLTGFSASAVKKIMINKLTSFLTLASTANIKVAKSSKVKLKVASSSMRFCKIVNSSLRGIRAGNCRVTITVTPKTGRASSKTITLRVAK